MLIQNLMFYSSKYAVSLIFLSFAVLRSSALYVVDGSNCTATCRTSPTGLSTNSSDVSCLDTDYNTTYTGVFFEGCVSCELESLAFEHGTGQTDLGWALCKQLPRCDLALAGA